MERGRERDALACRVVDTLAGTPPARCAAACAAALRTGGLGKREFAKRFINGLLCLESVDGDACGHCRSCLLLAAGSHPDLVALSFGLRKDGVQRAEIVVDQIRELSSRLAMRSQFGGWQVATIDPADLMNMAAANALLKTLEEPSAQTMLILLSDAPWRLPQTIRSRCQRIEFHAPSTEQASAWLEAEGVRDAAGALAAAAGNPGQALAWARDGVLEQRIDVRKDLAALAAGRGQPLEIVKRWLDNEPVQRLWFAAQAMADELKARSAGAAGPMASALDAEALDLWYRNANRARESLRGPLRNDLVLLELLAQWR